LGVRSGVASYNSSRPSRLNSLVDGGRRHAFAAWVALIGLIIPAAEVTFNMGGVKFTVGRFGIMLLLLPALVTLFQKSRSFVVSDFFVCATAIWMVAAGTIAPGSISLSSSVAESIELAGGYFVARAFFFGPLALHTFVRVLVILTFTAIALAMFDTGSGRLIVHDTLGSLLGVEPISVQYRGGAVRAASTFDHAILFGGFSCIVGTILLHSISKLPKRVFYVGLCLLGSILSWSSSSLMAFFIVFAAFAYNRIMHSYSKRWLFFWAILSVILLAFFVASNNPMGWIVSHLTLDIETGYYRFMIWDAVFAKLPESTIFGFGFNPFNNWILDSTVDSVWLVFALRFGVPAVLFLFLANVTSFLPTSSRIDNSPNEYMARMSTGFTTVLAVFMFIGLTVHFWNYIWIFWGICIGIRGSLREWSLAQQRKSPELAKSEPIGMALRARPL
jgi:hypothetical protein